MLKFNSRLDCQYLEQNYKYKNIFLHEDKTGTKKIIVGSRNKS